MLVHEGHPLQRRAEQNRAAELQTGLQRAQQHILDLKEQHDLDLGASKRDQAAGSVKLRAHCCALETQLVQLRQATASLHALEHVTALWPKAQTKVKYGTFNAMQTMVYLSAESPSQDLELSLIKMQAAACQSSCVA